MCCISITRKNKNRNIMLDSFIVTMQLKVLTMVLSIVVYNKIVVYSRSSPT